MPIAAYQEVTNYWALGKILCDIWTSCDVLCCTASILHLVAIALDRYWAISNVNYGSKRTNFRIISMILVIWLLSAVISILPHVFGLSFHYSDSNKQQNCQLTDNFIYQIFSTLGAFYLPLVVMCIIYWKIFQVAKFRIRKKAFQRPHANIAKNLPTQNVDAIVLIKEKLNSFQEGKSNRSRSINSSNNNNSPENLENDKNIQNLKIDRSEEASISNTNKKYSIIVKLTNTRRSFREILAKKRAIFKSILYFNKSAENQKMIRNEQNHIKLQKLDEKHDTISQFSFRTKESYNDDYNEFESYSIVDINKVIDDQNLTLDKIGKTLNQDNKINLKDDKSSTTMVPIAIPESYDTQSFSDSRTLVNIKFLANVRKLKHSLSNQFFQFDQNYKKKLCIRPSKSFDIKIYSNSLSNIESDDDETKQSLNLKDITIHFEENSNNQTETVNQMQVTKETEIKKDTENISLLGDINLCTNNNSIRKLQSNESIMISPIHKTQNSDTNLNSSMKSGSSQTKPNSELGNRKSNKLKKRNKIDIKRERKAAKTLGIIMSCFILCWLPFFIMQIINSICKQCATVLNNYPVVTILTWLGYMNSLLNPIIYTIFSPDFREAFAKILFGKCLKRKKKLFSLK